MADAGIREALVREGASRLLDARLQTPVRIASPAAGAEWVAVVPGGVYWQLLSVHMALTTSAVVANRIPRLSFRDGDGVELNRISLNASLPASTSGAMDALTGFGVGIGATVVTGPLPAPPMIMLGGWSVRSTTGAIDAADQYSNLVLIVREFSESQLAQELAVIADALGSIL